MTTQPTVEELRVCALCPTEAAFDEDAFECPDFGWLCPACADGHVQNCRTCSSIAREDHLQDMADARRKGEW